MHWFPPAVLAKISDFWKFQIAVWVFYIVGIVPIHVYFLSNKKDWESTLPGILLWCFSSVAVEIVLTSGLRYVYRSPFFTGVSWARKCGIVCALSLALAVGKTLMFDVHLASYVGHYTVPRTWFHKYGIERSISVVIHLAIFGTWSAIYLLSKELVYGSGRLERLRMLEKEKAVVEMRMLRSQIQPHFLYNALNALTTESSGSPRMGKLIEGMVDYLRYGLGHHAEAEVELGSEIDAVMHYIEVEKTRYGSGLVSHVHVDPAVRHVRTPGIFIQPLVENAIKYGRVTSPDLLVIRLSIHFEGNGLVIEVANTGRWVDKPVSEGISSTGVGLANLEKRLKLLYPGRYAFTVSPESGWVTARVHIQDIQRYALK